MAIIGKKSEVPEVEVKETKTRYSGMFNNAQRDEFEEIKAEYKAERMNTRTQADRRLLMNTYKEDLMDLACDAQIMQDWALLTELNQTITSLEKRTFTGSNRKY